MKIYHVLSIDYFHEDFLEQITITKLNSPPHPQFSAQKEVHTSISFYTN